jgi:magnesium chelatase subunit D
MRLPGEFKWEDACTAAAILAVDPMGVGGISLRSAPGPVRDQWLRQLGRFLPLDAPLRRIPLHVTDGRLLGGLDLAATMQCGRPIAERGLLASADGGVVVLAMAERVTSAVAAKICTVLDTQEVVFERDGFAQRLPSRFAVVALDEGIELDERPPGLLLERLALHVDLEGISASVAAASGSGLARRDLVRARGALKDVRVGEELVVALCEAAEEVGVLSARVCLFALRVARALAALDGRVWVTEEDAAAAARLVFASRVRRVPEETKTQTEQPRESEVQETQIQEKNVSLADRILQPTLASLPDDFCAHLQALNTASRQSGRRASQSVSSWKGRPAGVRAGDPRAGARLSVIETLRAAAPWQRLRAKLDANSPGAANKRVSKPHHLIKVSARDFRVIRCKRRSQLTTIFVVDASGSAAYNRLAEVKGAVELMLADSYVRRDRVALIAFRGKGAQMLLPPTHSLARVKRELASLPGGGGTPTASGLDTARGLADTLLRHGEAPVVVVLTDGRPNITRDGKGNRARAEADTLNAARLIRCNSIASVMVDTAPQPRMMTEQLAREMGAKYVPLPHVNAGALASVVQQCRA